MTLTFGSLFAGIGGFDLGFERAGMRCLWQVEIDDYCTRVLEKHWPDVERFRDVRKVHGIMAHVRTIGVRNRGSNRGIIENDDTRRSSTNGGIIQEKSMGQSERGKPCPTCLPPVDVICGGFPCQPHSYAGKRKGAEDDRDLWPEFKRIIDELRPRWVVAENVPGIRTTILDAVLSDLEGMGYATATAIIPACAVDAPHRRDRVWIVAYSASKQDNAKYEIWCRLSEQSGKAIATGTKAAQPQNGQASNNGVSGYGQTMADAISRNGYGRGGDVQMGRGWKPGNVEEENNAGRNQWRPEPDVGRVAHGVPARVD